MTVSTCWMDIFFCANRNVLFNFISDYQSTVPEIRTKFLNAV